MRYLALLLVLVFAESRSWGAQAKDAPATQPAAKSPTTAPSDVRAVSVAEFRQLQKDHPDYIVLDVRTPQEWSTGIIPSAKLIDIKSPDFDDKIAQPILIGRPAVIAARIAKAGLRMQLGKDVEVCNPEDDPRFRQYWEHYHQLMKRNGATPEVAKAAVRRSNTIIASLMVKLGDIPKQGQRIEFPMFDIVVKKMNGPRIVLIKVIPQVGRIADPDEQD